eukprot:2769861-Rhodomonas_salina.1
MTLVGAVLIATTTMMMMTTTTTSTMRTCDAHPSARSSGSTTARWLQSLPSSSVASASETRPPTPRRARRGMTMTRRRGQLAKALTPRFPKPESLVPCAN